MASEVLFESRNGVGYLTLNRPDKLNAFNRSMTLELQAKLDECTSDLSVRCIYLTGAGRAFSAGQDLSEVIGKEIGDSGKLLADYYNPIVSRLRNIEKPVVCAVNGTAAGAGANIALCCDIVVATHSAFFVQAFSRIGLIPDCGGTYFLPRLIGLQKASALMMLGDKIDAAMAEAMGMIYKTFPDEAFTASSVALAEKLANMPTRALVLTRKALSRSYANSLDQQLLVESELQQQATQTADFAEGVSAFLEKRPPDFKGK